MTWRHAKRRDVKTTSSFAGALHSDGPAADRAEKMKLYGWLVGSWTFAATVYPDDGSRHQGSGEIHFGWALQGRAIQDVWILPGVFYGTTLRVYDPGIDAWHILWSDPVRQVYSRQIGRGERGGIVQLGKNDAGETLRWSFTDITPDSFRWTGERTRDGGKTIESKTWQLQADFHPRRAS
jgi:hypothetical protein